MVGDANSSLPTMSSGSWSAGLSQFTIVCWCCSIRRTWASAGCKGPFTRAQA